MEPAKRRRVYSAGPIMDCRFGVAGSCVVREGPRLGTQSGWACQFCAYALGLKEVGLVRADRVSGHKSSKRVQTGEGKCKEIAMRRVLRFIFRGLIGVVALVGVLLALLGYYGYSPAPEVPRRGTAMEPRC
jgi:hypothetical protein